MFEKSSLPYQKNALEPYISEETMSYHYDKHLQAYVDKLNSLIKGTEMEKLPLIEIIRESEGGVYNNAAQFWNHEFFWQCMSPNGGGEPVGKILVALEKSFGSFTEFKSKFIESALENFGSGWTWLVQNMDGTLTIENYSNAGNPLNTESVPVLTVDIWEHSYYIDTRNDRKAYLENFFNVINWEFANENID